VLAHSIALDTGCQGISSRQCVEIWLGITDLVPIAPLHCRICPIALEYCAGFALRPKRACLTKRVAELRMELVLPKSGPVAQLGARFHGMEEVTGSIPVRSTKTSCSV
jgi:hypothetical protein